MLPYFLNKKTRLLAVIVLSLSLSGCLYWIRAYQTYVQMGEFDRYFKVGVTDKFTLHFNEPIMYSDDFIALAKLFPSENNVTASGREFRYWFRKVDKDNTVLKPEIKFYSELQFNQEQKITAWSFSPLFLEIAPPEFLEISLRSLGGAEINKETKQLRASPTFTSKISAELPKKQTVLTKLGQPLEVSEDNENEIYMYHFQLETYGIEKGYEDRALSEIKLSFDKSNHELVKMAGSFAGLKVSINYRKFQEQAPENQKQAKN